MFPKTLLTRLFNIQYPLIQAPMSPLTAPELVANVSNAGGMGTIAGARMTGEQLKQEIHQVRSLTNKPFGVNLFIPPSPCEISPQTVDSVRRQLKHLIQEKKLVNKRHRNLFLSRKLLHGLLLLCQSIEFLIVDIS